MATIYHLLDEAEAFSERDGGAISRWAANVLSEGSEIVVCPSYDSSWGFAVDRLYKMPYWQLVDRFHPVLYRLPWPLQKAVYRQVFPEFLRTLRKGDLVYVHNRPESAAVLATIAGQYGITVMLHMHNSLLLQANRGQLNALRKVPIVFCSDFIRREADAAYPNHFQTTFVVYNGADGEKFKLAEERNNPVPTVVYTGRLVPYKGVHVLLEAMRILEKRGIDAICKVVGGSGFGNSAPTRYIRNLMRRKPDNTELVGYVVGDALAELLKRADIFCAPSIWNDPFPLAPLEAFATGLPVVASNTGGLPEMLKHGGGVLVPPSDPEALAEALTKMIEDPPYRKDIGKKAYQSFVANFSWGNVRDQYRRVVQEVMG